MTKEYLKRQFGNFWSNVLNNLTKTDAHDGFIITDELNNIGVHLGTMEDWDNATYTDTYGFGGYPYGYHNLPPISKFSGIVEGDMISVDGGKGRWNGADTGNARCGGHLFEGWNAVRDARLTFGIGLSHKDTSFIATFRPHTSNAQTDGYYGVTKIGDDRLHKGTLFTQTLVKHTGLMCLSTSIPNDSVGATERLAKTGELAAEDYNATDKIPYGAMYFDSASQKVKVYTSTGWKALAWEVE